MVSNKLILRFTFLLYFEIFIIYTASGLNDFQGLYDSAKKFKSVPIAELALESAKSLQDDALIAKSYFLLAFYQKHQFMYYKSLDNYFRAFEHYRSVKNLDKQIGVLTNIGIIYIQVGFFDKAVSFYQDGIALAQVAGNKKRELTLRYQIARAYRLTGKFPEAKNVYMDLIPMFKAIDNDHFVSQCYLELGYITAKIGEEYDSANYFYTQAVNAYKTDVKAKRLTELTKMYSLAYMKIQNNSFAEAKDLLLSVLNQPLEDKDYRRIVIDVYDNLGDIYRETGNLDSAAAYYEKAMDSSHLKEFKKKYLHRAKYLRDYYSKLDIARSNKYGEIIFQFADQLSKLKSDLQEASHRYQVAAANYKHETELIYAQQRNRMIINAILYASLGLIMLIGFIYYFYERRKRIEKWRKALNSLTIKPGITGYP